MTGVVGIFMPTEQQYLASNKTNQFYLFIFLIGMVFPLVRSLIFLFVVKLDTPYYYAM